MCGGCLSRFEGSVGGYGVWRKQGGHSLTTASCGGRQTTHAHNHIAGEVECCFVGMDDLWLDE